MQKLLAALAVVIAVLGSPPAEARRSGSIAGGYYPDAGRSCHCGRGFGVGNSRRDPMLRYLRGKRSRHDW